MKKAACIAFVLMGIFCGPARGDDSSVLEERMAKEQRLIDEGYFILPHRPTYVMPMSYNPNPNSAVYGPGAAPLQDVETKFQISFKVPLADNLWKFPIRTYLAYTQVSYWQTYNKQDSSLFRETDYEPEFYLQFPSGKKMGYFTNRFNILGFDHQSNGQSDPLSRSWNRLYVNFVLDSAHTMLSIKPWFRLKGPPAQETNPDMEKYYGYGEVLGVVKFWTNMEFSLLFRNNFRVPENKGAVELGWSFPLTRRMKGYVQYYNGYGESLINYNVPVSRTSVGVSFSDWL